MIDDIRRPSRRAPLEPTKIDPQIFRPGSSARQPKVVLLPEEPKEQHNDALFKTPEQVADTEDDHVELDNVTPVNASKLPKKSKKFWQNWSKKKKMSIAIAMALILISGSITTWLFTKSGSTTVAVKKESKKPAPTPTIYYSTLTGAQIDDPALNASTVTAVMIENSTDARPQSGLDKAGVVFEAIAEGGITRFVAVYQDTAPDYIGPIRSARPYYVQWIRGFDAAYAHVGGSPLGLQTIRDLGVRDLEYGVNSNSYERITARYSPHNVYSGLPALNQLEQAKNFTGSTYTGFERKDDTKSDAPNAVKIDISLSSALYNSHYDYNAETNSYTRNQAGAIHNALNKDGSQTPITPKVIVALGMTRSQDGIYSVYNVIGNGPVTVFQDGTAIQGSWEKASPEAQIILKDTNGAPIKLNRGQTWFTATAGLNQVSFTP